MDIVTGYVDFLTLEGKSKNTIGSYMIHVKNYILWLEEFKNVRFETLIRENVLEYKKYLRDISSLNAKSINAKLAALIKLNDYLIDQKIQNDVVIYNKDYVKIQTSYLNPSTVSRDDVEEFRRELQLKCSSRDYAIGTLLAYAGLRISEALNIKLYDINLAIREITIQAGKNEKQRLVVINKKIIDAIEQYLPDRLKEKYSKSEYLFISRQSGQLSQCMFNRCCQKYSKTIKPHVLRHFFCSNAIAKGWSLPMVALQAGHSQIQTTVIYTNPSKADMKDMANEL